MDNPYRKPGSNLLLGELKDTPTGVHEEQVRARIVVQGGQELPAPQNGQAAGFMCFRKFMNGRWFHFTVPRAMGPDGYHAHELTFIENTLERYDIDLYPIDRHLH